LPWGRPDAKWSAGTIATAPAGDDASGSGAAGERSFRSYGSSAWGTQHLPQAGICGHEDGLLECFRQWCQPERGELHHRSPFYAGTSWPWWGIDDLPRGRHGTKWSAGSIAAESAGDDSSGSGGAARQQSLTHSSRNSARVFFHGGGVPGRRDQCPCQAGPCQRQDGLLECLRQRGQPERGELHH